MPQVGDIVEVTGFPGVRWVVEGPAASAIPPERVWRCVAHGGPSGQTSRLVGDGDLSTIRGGIVFEPGQEVRHRGHPAEVVADLGAVVRIRMTKRREVGRHPLYAGGVYIEQTGETDADKAALVLENLSRFPLEDSQNGSE